MSNHGTPERQNDSQVVVGGRVVVQLEVSKRLQFKLCRSTIRIPSESELEEHHGKETGERERMQPREKVSELG